MKSLKRPDFSGLNEAQYSAVTHGEGPILVLAGPGSGKTLTITNRISYLITEKEIPPENILVITFTKEAALSMQERFFEQEKKPYPIPVYFGTFHALFYHIIQNSKGNHAPLLGETKKRALLIPILKKYQKQFSTLSSADTYEEAGSMLSSMSYYKNTGNMKKASQKLQKPWQEHFHGILKEYEEKRRSLGEMDFDDMAFEVLRLLKSDALLCRQWQQQFSHILIDEFQDINPMQYQAIKCLLKPPFNLFAVGDDDQSVYGFRGSEPERMQRFLQDYPLARQILLNVNYRSSKEIVCASQKVIRENSLRFPKELKAAEEDSHHAIPVCCKGFLGKTKEYGYLIEELQKRILTGDLNQCAVLFRTNMQMQSFASGLKKAKIPYVMREKSRCIYDHFVVQDVNTFYRFAQGERSRTLFLKIMNKPSRWLLRDALTEERVVFEELRSFYRQYPEAKRVETIMAELDRLERGMIQLADRKPALGIRFIQKGLGYEKYLRERAGTDLIKLEEWKELLEWLIKDCENFQSFQDWYAYQEAFRKEKEGKEPLEPGGRREGEGGVHLMSVHGSKGLEFERVYLPDVNEGNYPHSSGTDTEAVEEERRILYVAMTRAKKALELLFVTGTKEHPRLPSRFLRPLL